MEIIVRTKTPEELADIEDKLRDIAGGVEFAQRHAVNDALRFVRSQVIRRISKRYDIKASTLRDRNYFSDRVRAAEGNSVTASLYVSGQQVPLFLYNGSSPRVQTPLDYKRPVPIHGRWVMAHPSQRATGHQLRGTPTELPKNYFVATMPNGHTGIFVRDGGKTQERSATNDPTAREDAISEIFGSSAAVMMGSPEVSEGLSEDATERYDTRLSHYVTALLTGALRVPGSGSRRSRRAR